MLLVGIDGAETQHAVCLLTPVGMVIDRLTVPQTPAGLRQLHTAMAPVEPDAPAVLIAIERPDGLRVSALRAAAYSVYALNPQVVARYRGRTRTTGAKRDPADAELLARIRCTDRDRHQPLRPSSPLAEEIRALARQDARASRAARRFLNRLRADLVAVSPQALTAFPDLDTVSACAFLDRWPRAEQAQRVSQAEIAAFLRTQRHSYPRPAAERIHTALHAEALTAPAHLARAKAGAIQLTAQQLRLLQRQRATWEKRLRALLAGAESHPDGEVLLC